MKAILIARVSTEEQREAGNSLPAQVTRLERYCQSKGFPILRTCSFDESAYKKQRNEFDRILDFILEQTEKVAVCCDKVEPFRWFKYVLTNINSYDSDNLHELLPFNIDTSKLLT